MRSSRELSATTSHPRRCRSAMTMAEIMARILSEDPASSSFQAVHSASARSFDEGQGNIRKAAQIGVKLITYHCEVIPYRRNGKTTGRGGIVCDSFRLEDDWKSVPIGNEGRVT